MIKITPYKISTPNIQSMKNEGEKSSFVSFSADLQPARVQFNNLGRYPIPPNLSSVKTQEIFLAPTWLKDATITKALSYLNNLEFEPSDVREVQSQGSILPFLSGKEAVNFIKNSNTRIKFSAMPSSNIHAQYDYENNFIKVSELYKNTQNPAEILAIAEAILHEAGHAKDTDGQSSIQEEINCLALNALSHRAFSKTFPNVFSNADSLIIKDGVSVYSELFFDKDPSKTKLINRIQQKYGFLPTGDFNHPPSELAFKVKKVYN